MKYNIALLHYSGPPVVGGVEEIVRQQASVFHRFYHRVKIFVGQGSVFSDMFEVEVNPSQGWKPTPVMVEEKRPLRIKAEGTYRFDLGVSGVTAAGFPDKDPGEDMVTGIPCGALMGNLTGPSSTTSRPPQGDPQTAADTRIAARNEGMSANSIPTESHPVPGNSPLYGSGNQDAQLRSPSAPPRMEDLPSPGTELQRPLCRGSASRSRRRKRRHSEAELAQRARFC